MTTVVAAACGLARLTRNKANRVFSIAACVAIVVTSAVTSGRALAQQDASPAVTPPKFVYHDAFDAAQTAAREKKRVTAVFFTASWCGWCRKLEADTLLDAKVREAAAAIEWVKVDIDRQPDLAERYDVSGVPDVVLLDIQGRVINRSSGYMPAEAFIDFLNKAADKVEGVDPLRDVRMALDAMRRDLAIASTDADSRKAIESVLVMLARADRSGRKALIDGMKGLDARGASALLSAMNDERLAVRAAAAAALSTSAGVDVPFDPFGDASARALQIDTWRKAIEKQRSAAN